MTATRPRHGDGNVYTGECLCCGIIRTGTVAKAKPRPYWSTELFTSTRVWVVVISDPSSALGHEVPVSDLTIVPAPTTEETTT